MLVDNLSAHSAARKRFAMAIFVGDLRDEFVDVIPPAARRLLGHRPRGGTFNDGCVHYGLPP